MLEELSSKDKVVGLKQVQRAVSAGRAGWVFLACDADPRLTRPLPGTGRSHVRGAHHGPAGPGLRHRRGHRRRGAAGKGKTASNGIKSFVPWKI